MKSTKKAETLRKWRGLPDNADPLGSMIPIPYKTSGSRYGCCGIRIDGTPEFIDAVLGRIKSILAGENHYTRLECARHTVERQAGFSAGENAVRNAEVCYVRLHVRGGEAQHMSAMYDRSMDSATMQFADAVEAGIGAR